ncbi:MAG: hypothetical protein K9K80_00475 [Spirochaetia bacterium]|nr:hypothetical protein [Spirochaetia bacterium]MCF7952503.1 hypothetical protein [Spirochaetales bacterium]
MFITKDNMIKLLRETVKDEGMTYQVFIPSWQWEFEVYAAEAGASASGLFRNDIKLPYTNLCNGKEKVIEEIEKAQERPLIRFGEGDLLFHYDIYIWGESWYMVYNPYLQKIEVHDFNDFFSLMKSSLLPEWTKNSQESLDTELEQETAEAQVS